MGITINHDKDPYLNNQDSMESKKVVFFFVAHLAFFRRFVLGLSLNMVILCFCRYDNMPLRKYAA